MAFGDISALVQKTWPGWEVVRLIGKGSYGSVYEIQESRSGKLNRSAVKIISIPEEGAALPIGQDIASLNTYYSSIAETMEQEYITARELKNAGCRNVVGCDSYVKVPNANGIGLKLLIKMELLTDLNSHIRKNGISRQDVIHLGIDICRALEICRTNHVFHRDIKPANLFVSADGRYKLGDFGVAKRLEETGYAGSKQGTILYMAPEVYANRDYDHRADMYSLGLVMYQLLNKGRLPFMSGVLNEHSQGEALRRRMRGDTMPMPSADDGELAEIVLRACSHDYRLRYFDPAQMRWELEQLVNDADKKMMIAPVDTNAEVQVRFLDEDGTVLLARNYRLGERLTVPAISKNKEKNGVARVFERWNPPLPETATMTMDYRATYKKEGPIKLPEPSKKKIWPWIVMAALVVLLCSGFLLLRACDFSKEEPKQNSEVITQKPAEKEEIKFSLDKDRITLIEGQEQTLTCEGLSAEKANAVVWKTSDETVAIVSAGKVTALKKGTATITAAVDGVSAQCTVLVIAREVESIAIKSKPTKTDYYVGEALVTDGLVLEMKYNDGNMETVTSGFRLECDMSTPEENKTVKVFFGEEETSYTINVVKKDIKLVSIAVATLPNLTSYNQDQTLQTDGLTLKATYDDGTTGVITSGFTCTPMTFSQVGQQVIIVNYGAFQTSFKVSVSKGRLRYAEAFHDGTGRTTYYIGETFDPSGYFVKLFYKNGTEEIVPMSTCDDEAWEIELKPGNVRNGRVLLPYIKYLNGTTTTRVYVVVTGITLLEPEI